MSEGRSDAVNAFATVRLRTYRAKGCLSRKTAVVLKLTAAIRVK